MRISTAYLTAFCDSVDSQDWDGAVHIQTLLVRALFTSKPAPKASVAKRALALVLPADAPDEAHDALDEVLCAVEGW
jgi:hypothetical protein